MSSAVPELETTSDTPRYVVGIGASAGGLEALEQLFDALPDVDTGLAFVVVQHLSPDYKSLMAEILGKHTRLPIKEATHQVAVLADHVYLIPPGKTITIANGLLLLTDKVQPRGLSLPIDIFFHSLAEDLRERAIAVILSGTGSDGTRGIRTIKEHDGMVVVQTSDSAKFDGMPRSAIATGLADLILPPDEIPEGLLRYVSHPQIQHTEHTQPPKPHYDEDNILGNIISIIHDQTDVDFSQYKPATVLRRIERRAGLRQCRDAAEYLRLLQGSPSEQRILYKELLIGVTKFFRDPEAYEQLASKVLPAIFASHGNEEQLRIWVTACSTGEEAYSLAILFDEERSRLNSRVEVKIFATDIDQDAIDFAADGSYPESLVADITSERLSRYFNKIEHEGRYKVTPGLRKMVVFAQHDLTKSPPFNRLNLISCRNLFIYLEPKVQERILHLFHFALLDEGYLFLGESESIADGNPMFSTIDRHHKLYQTRSGIRPTLPRWREGLTLRPIEHAVPPPIASGPLISRQMGDYVHRVLLERFLPPCVLINDNFDILYISEGAAPYLRMRGLPDYNLPRLLPDRLATFVRSAVSNALKHDKNVVFKAFPNSGDNGESSINLHVEPIVRKHSSGRMLLVRFEPVNLAPSNGESQEEPMEVDSDFRSHLDELERELAYTRETLQATIEELETSNEELQSTNEELLAANEELQSTNEELQAVNEELITVNSEHQHKIKEEVELNETYSNLLRATGVGVLFLDQHLTIRRFTPAIREEMHLKEGDIGRPFEDIRHHLNHPDLKGIFNRVMLDNAPQNIEITSDQGAVYLVKIAPYRLSDGTVDGVVLSLIDISELRHAEEARQIADERLLLATAAACIGVWEWVPGSNTLFWDAQMYSLYRIDEAKGSISYLRWHQSIHPDDVALLEHALRDTALGRQPVLDTQVRILWPDDSIHYLRLHARLRQSQEGQAASLIGVCWDITDTQELDRLFKSTQHLARVGGWEYDVTSGRVLLTDEVYRIYEQPIGSIEEIGQLLDTTHPEDRPLIDHALQQAEKHGQIWDIEYRIITGHNTVSWVRSYGEAIHVEGHRPKLRGLLQDVQQRKQLELEQKGREQDILRMLEDSPVPKLVVAPNNRIEYVNAAFQRLFGYSDKQLDTMQTLWQTLTADSQTQEAYNLQWRNNLAEIAKQGMAPPLELKLFNHDGTPLYLRLHSVRLANGSSLSEFIDLSSNHRTEEALRNAQLSAEAASRTKSLFLTNMSHELRTPLNAILGFAQLLERDEQLSQEHHEAVNTILSSGTLLLNLINDILDLSKIEAGRLDLEMNPFDLKLTVTRIVEMFNQRMRQKGLAFRHRFIGQLPRVVNGDEKRIQEICINLIGNALKFTDQGEVRFEVSYANNELNISVSDTGIGIPQDRLRAIFEPFTQEGDDRYRRQGTGLGLAITRQLAEQMGGRLDVVSNEGQGSRFEVFLPLSSVDQEGEEGPAYTSGYRRIDGKDEPVQILVVDDIEANRELMRAMLEPLGFTLHMADSGERAIAMVEKLNPDLVLMDLVMPGLNGLEATRRIHRLPERRELPIIAVSARAFPEDKRASLTSGCVTHISKPVHEQALFSVMADFLPIEWLHIQEPGPEEEHSAVGAAQELAEFSPEILDDTLRQQLHEAIISGSQQRIRQVLASVAQQHPDLITPMSLLFREYEYDTVLNWLDD